MNITDIRIRKTYNDTRLKALVSVTIDGDLAVHDIKVIEGPEREPLSGLPCCFSFLIRSPLLPHQLPGYCKTPAHRTGERTVLKVRNCKGKEKRSCDCGKKKTRSGRR